MVIFVAKKKQNILFPGFYSNPYIFYCVVVAEQGINILPVASSVAWNILQILHIVQRLEATFRTKKTQNKQCTSLPVSQAHLRILFLLSCIFMAILAM